MRRQVAILCKTIIALAILAGGGEPARASDTVAAPPKTGERAHPNAKKINEGNTGVLHAGPGLPLTGAVHVSPAQGKKEKPKEH
jgi:hypothetical protein